jgi:predicted transcriptional regulator
MSDTRIIRIVIPEELHRRLKSYAGARGRPLYQVLREALTGYVDLKQPQGNQKARPTA